MRLPGSGDETTCIVCSNNIEHECCIVQNPHMYLMAALFSLTGYLGINFVLVLVRSFGALLAVTGIHVIILLYYNLAPSPSPVFVC